MKGTRWWLTVATLYVNIPPLAVANLIPSSLRDVTGSQTADRSSEAPPFCFTPRLRILISQTCVNFFYCVCIVVFTLDAGLLARSRYPEGPTIGLLDTVFLVFPGSKSIC
jgi:hypothetical protein